MENDENTTYGAGGLFHLLEQFVPSSGTNSFMLMEQIIPISGTTYSYM